MSGILFVISAPSGGKTTLIRELRITIPEIYYSISLTTRPPRKHEKHMQDYCFVTESDFNQKKTADGLIESAFVHGYWYGTPRDFEAHLKAGTDVLLDIDVQGGKQIKKLFPDAVLIFIAPPSLSVLETRLRARRQDDEAAIQRRLRGAQTELTEAQHYDYLILNDQIDKAVDQLKCIVVAERRRMRRSQFSLEKLSFEMR